MTYLVVLFSTCLACYKRP